MFKKGWVIFVCFILLVGCNTSASNNTEVAYKENEIIKVYNLNIEIVKVEKTSTIHSQLNSGEVISLLDTEYEFIEVLVMIKNNGENYKRDDLDWSIKTKDNTDKTKVSIESRHFNNIDSTMIEKDQKQLVHFYTPIKKGSLDETVELVIDEGMTYRVPVGLNNLKIKDLKLNETLNFEDYDLTINKVELQKEIKPSNTDETHTYIKVNADNENLLTFNVTVNNKSSKSLELNKLLFVNQDDFNFVSDFSWNLETEDKTNFNIVSNLDADTEKEILFVSVVEDSTIKTTLIVSINNELYKVTI